MLSHLETQQIDDRQLVVRTVCFDKFLISYSDIKHCSVMVHKDQVNEPVYSFLTELNRDLVDSVTTW